MTEGGLTVADVVSYGVTHEILIFVVQLDAVDRALGHVPDFVADDPCLVVNCFEKGAIGGDCYGDG